MMMRYMYIINIIWVHEMVRLSVIIPNYNSERYILDCLNSIIQDKRLNKLIEVLIIDDGSKDNSIKIIEKWIKDNNNIDVNFIKLLTNHGSGYVRNYAIDLAKGDYLFYVDCDDLICAEKIFNVMKEIDDEVYFFDTWDLIKDELKVSKYSYINMFNVSGNLKINEQEEIPNNIRFGWAPWHYIIKRDFVITNDIRFGDGSVGDDIYFTSKVYQNMKKINITNERCYMHRIGTGISKNKHTKEMFTRYIKVYKEILKKYNYGDMLFVEILYLNLIKGILIENISVSEYKEMIKNVYDLIDDEFKDNMLLFYKIFYRNVMNENDEMFECYKTIIENQGRFIV